MSFVSLDAAFWHAGTVNVPAARRVSRPQGLEVFVRQSLSTDSIGNFALTLTNLIVGSAVRVELAGAGSEVGSDTASSSSLLVNIPAYSPGSANNNLRIKVRKGTASPYYIPYETLATAFVGAQSIYVSQIPDE